jgi:hypothetical protein
LYLASSRISTTGDVGLVIPVFIDKKRKRAVISITQAT